MTALGALAALAGLAGLAGGGRRLLDPAEQAEGEAAGAAGREGAPFRLGQLPRGELTYTGDWHPDADTAPASDPGGSSIWCGIARKP